LLESIDLELQALAILLPLQSTLLPARIVIAVVVIIIIIVVVEIVIVIKIIEIRCFDYYRWFVMLLLHMHFGTRWSSFVVVVVVSGGSGGVIVVVVVVVVVVVKVVIVFIGIHYWHRQFAIGLVVIEERIIIIVMLLMVFAWRYCSGTGSSSS
jgi:hypothetical protein